MAKNNTNKDFFYPVTKEPLSDYMPDGVGFNSKITHGVFIDLGNGNRRMVNACSKNYTVIPNADIFKPLEEVMKNEFNAVELKGYQLNLSKYYMDFILQDKEMEIIKNDTVFPKIRVMNSYDGSLRYSFSLGFYRLICSNGMTAPVGKGVHLKMRHTPSAIGKWEQVVGIAQEFMSNAKDMLRGYKELASHKLNMADAQARIDEILEKTKAPTKKKEEMYARLQLEADMKLPISDWLVYNAVNYELNHGVSRAPLHKKDRVDEQVLQYLLTH